jgi:hypothetical protein
MGEPPCDREEFWIRFICAFLCFGLLTSLMLRYIHELGIFAGLGIWMLLVLTMSSYAARVGDHAWRKLVNLMFGWR